MKRLPPSGTKSGPQKVITVDFRGVGRELTAAQIKPKEVNWLWYPRIAAGTLSIIGAKGGTGKGMMLTDLAARITRGSLWPMKKCERAPLGNVLWCETEDMLAETVVPRLIAAGADLTRVVLKSPAEFFALDLNAYVEERDVRLIVLSPFNSFLQGLDDTNSGQGVRKRMQKLQDAIEGTSCAIVGICHLNKKTDLDAIERLLGSVEYVNFVRNVLLLNSDDEFTVRVVHAKHNISTHGDDLLFTKVNRRPEDKRGAYWGVDWERAEENVDPDRVYDRKTEDGADSKNARKFLFDFLADGEWHDFEDIKVGAGARNIEVDAVQKAQQRSKGKVEWEKRGFNPQSTFWRLVPGA